MPKKKNVEIKYTSREFDTIKEDLVDYAKRYYPNSYRDFTKASFGSMVLDSVAYVGDVLSYYIDYSVNESFLDTSSDFDNIRKHARALGYNFFSTPSSFGEVALFVSVPANSAGTAPDTSYLPILKKGASFSTSDGRNFILTEHVNFNDPKSQFVATGIDSATGLNTYFAVKAYGQVKSGVIEKEEIDLTNEGFEKFKLIRIGDSDISEIISVFDSSGNQYHQVDTLSQEVIFKETTNKNAHVDGVRSILKPFVTTRRFTLEQDDTGTYLQFGFGSEEEDSIADALAEPAQVALKLHGKRQITTSGFDPSKLLSTDKLGVAPSNTILSVSYRTNSGDNTSAAANAITSVNGYELVFPDENSLLSSEVQSVRASLELTNEEPVTSAGADIPVDELKQRIKSHYAAQGRAVTKQDYESLVYNMPASFGSIKRANIINDMVRNDRKIKMYVISEDSDNKLSYTSSVTKNNIKNWLKHYKSLNDVVEIHDAKIINFSVDFKVMTDRRFNSDEVLFDCIEELKSYFDQKLYIGEPLYITRIYDQLNNVDGVVDVKRVTINNKVNGVYSILPFNFNHALSSDGTYYKVPKNVILELKFSDLDIQGIAI
tara:strand:+ start:257 stop:2062 length:1806 start_codon:yes stop_codon:yes gene_type:complete